MSIVLLVEDNPLNQVIVEDIFAYDEVGGELATVDDGQKALEEVPKLHPDLILMDIRLPGMNGLEVTRRLKQDPATRDIPIWAISADAMKGHAEEATKAGCSAYITKPINAHELADRLRDFLGSQES